MKIRIETETYNPKKFGKPWIAVVNYKSGRGDFKFGEWDGKSGNSGILTAEATVKDIVARGQKCFADPKKTWIRYYSVNPDGELSELFDRDEAKVVWDNLNEGGKDE